MSDKLLQTLSDLKENIKDIQDRVAGINEKSFHHDHNLKDALTYRLAVIGEIVNKLPTELTDRYKHIPWHAIVSMRNILIHEYEAVDYYIVWDTVQNELPELLVTVEQMIKESQ